MPRTAYLLTLLLLATTLTAGCALRPTVEAVSKFSVALEGASLSVQQQLGGIQQHETAAGSTYRAVQESGSNSRCRAGLARPLDGGYCARFWCFRRDRDALEAPAATPPDARAPGSDR